MARTPTGNRNQTIHCDICGEDYAATYKRCPFCEGHPEQNATSSRRGGRRTSNSRGGGYSDGPSPRKVISTVLSLALIVAAVCIVVSIVKPMVDRGKTPTPSATPVPSPSAPVESALPSPAPAVPADQTATGFTLDKSDFTTSYAGESYVINPTFSPAGSKGYLEWTSSDPEVVSVDESGTVRAIGKVNGVSRATITATLKGTNISQSCIVRCSFDAPAGGSAAQPSTAPAPSGSAKLNKEDFTMPAGSTVQMRVSGTDATPTWSIANTSVATVDSSGLVTMVGRGNTTLTCTVGGQTLTCIVRCS